MRGWKDRWRKYMCEGSHTAITGGVKRKPKIELWKEYILWTFPLGKDLLPGISSKGMWRSRKIIWWRMQNSRAWKLKERNPYMQGLPFLPVAQSCLECGWYVPSVLCLVLVDLFLASNLCMWKQWCCWVAKTAKCLKS